ncbi:MAG TPA: BMP family ABC transporter substrate-binding protein [Kineosporiaceae bacterium]
MTTLVAVATTATLALAACGGGSGGGSSSSSAGASGASSAVKSKVKVGLAYDIGGRGDKSFNDSAAAGLDKAKSELGLPDPKELSASKTETDADKEQRLKLLAQAGYNPVIAIGFSYATALGKVVKDFPNTKFAIVDATVDAPNVTDLVFAENEGSFLAGAAAALKSKTGNVGYIGGCLVPLLQKFEAGFTAGAKAVNPTIKVQVKYLSNPPTCSGFNDPAAGTETANGLYDGGADVVFAAAGGSGTGVFQSAKAKGKKAIGVDSDQYLTASADLQPVILTSMLKKVDVAVYGFITSFVNGSPLTGVQTFDLKKDGVGYATSGGQVDDIKSKLDDYKQQIIDGKITVPAKPGA